jgi:hypothetical protein
MNYRVSGGRWFTVDPGSEYPAHSPRWMVSRLMSGLKAANWLNR